MKKFSNSYPYDDKHFAIGSGVRIEVNEKKKVNVIVYDRKGEHLIVSAFGYNLPGKMYKLYYMDKTRRDAIYIYEAVSENVLLYEGLQAIQMRLVGEPVKVQRRNYFRVEYRARALLAVRRKAEDALNVHIEKRNSDSESKYSWEKKEALIVDISAGGMKVRTDEAIEKNTVVQGLFEAEGESIRFSGIVVRGEHSGKSHYIGIRYVDMAEDLKQKIVSLVFEIERKRLKVEKK